MTITESELKKQIKEGRLQRVYFFYGEETYLSGHYAAQVAAKAVGGDEMAAFNLQKFDGRDCTMEELEDAAYKYVEFYGDGGEQHERGGAATIIESIVFTKEKQFALGLTENSLPEAWWIGFHVHDPEVWEKVKDGTYPMCSIEGEAIREEI